MDESPLDPDSPTGGDAAQLDLADLPDDGDNQKGSSNQNRKVQNRIAQREFRLRKQQYIRDLEAKVEVLSGDKEERAELMTLLIRNLLKENKDLRNMVRAMASFLGDGLGSCLPRLGLTAAQLDAILNQTDGDTAHEAFLNLKAAQEALDSSAAGPSRVGTRKRSGSTSKRKRADTGQRTVDSDLAPPEETEEGDGDLAGAGVASSSKGKSRALDPAEEEMQSQEDEYMYLFPELQNLLVPLPPPLSSGVEPGPSALPQRQQQHQPQPQHHQQQQQQHHNQRSDIPPPPASYQQPYGYARDLVTDVNPKAPPEPMRSNYPTYGQSPRTAFRPSPRPYNLTVTDTGLTPNMSSLAGPPMSPTTSGSQAEYAQRHPQLFHVNPTFSEAERQLHMGSAMAVMTTPRARSHAGPGMTGAEMLVSRESHGRMDPTQNNSEAMRLITYHLDAYRANPDFTLPPSLQPTSIQRTIPHEHAIDSVIFPSIRDRMILLRGQYDLRTIFDAIQSEVRLVGEDMLDHRDYEVSERFCNDYSMMMDDEVYAITNKWRAMRGEAPVQRSEGRPVE